MATDPPYHLGSGTRPRQGFMGMEWDGGAVAFDPRSWTLCLQAVRPGAHLLAFGGTRTFHRLATAIEDGGWTIRDTVCWHYGNGIPKHKGSMKPATELICVARAPLDGTIAETVERHGTGRLWPERCRTPLQQGERIPQFESGTGPVNPAGRWPGNVVHDGSDAVLDLFPPATGQQAAVPPSRASDPVAYASSSKGSEPRLDSGSAARFFYCAKASRRDRETGLAPAEDGSRRNRRPTVKPIALMRWLIRLACPEGGTVLDPFCGSGTTGIPAAAEGMSFVGIERDPEYAALARERIGAI